MTFIEKNSFEKRIQECTRILLKYPDKVPIIIEKDPKSNFLTPDIEKHKYLVSGDFTFGNFFCIIRKKLKLKPEEAIFMFIDNILPINTCLISQLYKEHKNEDGFLYIKYNYENTFGK